MKNKRKYIMMKAVDRGDHVLRFKGTTETVDRYNEVLTLSGWDLKEYKKNPIFLWAHNYHDLPVGKTIKLQIKKEDGMYFDVKFPDRDTYPLGDTIYRLYKEGYLKAVSVGFIPKENNYDKDKGIRYITKKELIELSGCPIGANPDALITDAIGKAVEDHVINDQEYQELILSAKEMIGTVKKMTEADGRAVDPQEDRDISDQEEDVGFDFTEEEENKNEGPDPEPAPAREQEQAPEKPEGKDQGAVNPYVDLLKEKYADSADEPSMKEEQLSSEELQKIKDQYK